MKSQIVVVFGPTRAGKDTLLQKLMERLANAPPLPRVLQVSSIDVVKGFFDQVRTELGAARPAELTARTRQALSDVKKVLDGEFNWTARYAIRRIEELEQNRLGGPAILLYQVRELDNIRKLAGECRGRFGLTSIYIQRHRDARSAFAAAEGADSDRYKPDDPWDADLVVINGDITDLDIHVDAAARLILRKMKEGCAP